MSWTYDSGGKHKDHKKYRENWERIFGGNKASDSFTEADEKAKRAKKDGSNKGDAGASR